MKALVGAFNQEKALVGAFSVITNLRMELFEALVPGPGRARQPRPLLRPVQPVVVGRGHVLAGQPPPEGGDIARERVLEVEERNFGRLSEAWQRNLQHSKQVIILASGKPGYRLSYWCKSKYSQLCSADCSLCTAHAPLTANTHDARQCQCKRMREEDTNDIII